jgi:hypothetical protein
MDISSTEQHMLLNRQKASVMSLDSGGQNISEDIEGTHRRTYYKRPMKDKKCVTVAKIRALTNVAERVNCYCIG